LPTTDIQTDVTECITMPHSRLIMNNKYHVAMSVVSELTWRKDVANCSRGPSS